MRVIQKLLAFYQDSLLTTIEQSAISHESPKIFTAAESPFPRMGLQRSDLRLGILLGFFLVEIVGVKAS